METPRQIVERYWRLMNTNDWDAVGAVLHDDFLLTWPQSGERIRGRVNFSAVNAQYPATDVWRFAVRHLVADEAMAASRVAVTMAALNAEVISFFEPRDGLIWRVTEYWPEPFEAAVWRAQLVERDGA
ncbi:MAG TPA: nuclear transport factor 2 family protein [Ktedonobacterales bacterium]|nr:nuclear transport factor 2 family protein [Ktedonobacterales bacterium]